MTQPNLTCHSSDVCLFVSVLQIIELQNEIWDLQNKDVNGTAGDRIKGTLRFKVLIEGDTKS